MARKIPSEAPLVLAGLLPMLLFAYLASALANRLAFAGWGIAVAIVAAAGRRRTGASAGIVALLAVAVGWAGLAWLAHRWANELELGARAVVPALAGPTWTSPLLCLFAMLVAALVAVRGVRRTRRRVEADD